MPVVSPTGVQAVNPDGEVGRGPRRRGRGTAMGHRFASKPVEEVTAVNERPSSRSTGSAVATPSRTRRARARGRRKGDDRHHRLELFNVGRDWGSPGSPEDGLKLWPRWRRRATSRFATVGSAAAGHPQALPLAGLRPQHRPGSRAALFHVYGTWMGTPPPTWEDIVAARAVGRPFMLRASCGSTTPSARRRRGVGDLGLQPRRQQPRRDPATIRALPGLSPRPSAAVEVLLDGGVRRGSDVVKALAPYARAVMTAGHLGDLRPTVRPVTCSTSSANRLRPSADSGKVVGPRPRPDDVLVPLDFSRGLGAQ